ncbi:MAG: putative toxin-antitoxin system toxin component, PIN family [Bacteroidales bacterium]|nr:putative toxin-antitoxin system toxin component, PIN family [Bacteroidales bacterium]
MIHAVIDTNVLVSMLMAKSEDSTVIKLLNTIIDGRITTLYNTEIIDEYCGVLARPKFKFPSELQDALIQCIVDSGIDSTRTPYNETMPDESDRVFYEVALSKDESYLVTGNLKHFPKTPIVVTPAEMLAILSHNS